MIRPTLTFAEGAALHYADLDLIVDQISARILDQYGEPIQPYEREYESGGHTAYASWVAVDGDGNPSYWVGVILGDSVEDSEFIVHPIEKHLPFSDSASAFAVLEAGRA